MLFLVRKNLHTFVPVLVLVYQLDEPKRESGENPGQSRCCEL